MPSGFSGNLNNSPADQDCAELGSATNVEDQVIIMRLFVKSNEPIMYSFKNRSQGQF